MVYTRGFLGLLGCNFILSLSSVCNTSHLIASTLGLKKVNQLRFINVLCLLQMNDVHPDCKSRGDFVIQNVAEC